MIWSLTPGQAGYGPEGRRLIEAMGGPPEAGKVALLMDSAYEGNATQELAQQLGFVPVVPANPKRGQPHKLDKVLYRRRNEVEIYQPYNLRNTQMANSSLAFADAAFRRDRSRARSWAVA